VTLKNLARRTVKEAVGASILLIPWGAAALVAELAVTPLAPTLGVAAAVGLTALAAPPLALGFTYVLRGALRALLVRFGDRIAETRARTEGDALLRDSDFLESLAQMQRGEHRPWNEIKQEPDE
jgi:hypothetical protein